MIKHSFRYDINALRAIAVILVILFHFKVSNFRGGFIGVDIFFVISGFLMFEIIFRSLKENTFSIKKFVLNRANRIIPPLFFMMLMINIIGWFFLLPFDYVQLIKHSLSSLTFTSNYLYMMESGYFDSISIEKPLLHTWSLSVEWQFYILLPILVALIYKKKALIKLFPFIIFLLMLLSFLYSNYLVNIDRDFNYYSIFSRSWELLFGGLTYLVSCKLKGNKFLFLLGFSLIIMSLLFVDSESIWPSYLTIPCILGASLIILSNLNNIFVNNFLFNWIGKSSYSIYLWHWPVVYILNYFDILQGWYIGFGILISFLLGFSSYKLIELFLAVKIKEKSQIKQMRIHAFSLILISMMFVLIFNNDGYKDRFSSNVNKALLGKNDQNPRKQECFAQGQAKPIGCKYGDGDVKAIVIGDSHAQAIMRSVEKSLVNGGSVLDWSAILCGTFDGAKFIRGYGYHCGSIIDYILIEKSKYKEVPIIVSNRLNLYLLGGGSYNIKKPITYVAEEPANFNSDYQRSMINAYIKTICRLSENNPVFIVSQIPEQNYNVPIQLAKKLIIENDPKISISKSLFDERSKLSNYAQGLAVKKCGAKILDASNYLCDKHKCYASKDQKPLYYDYDHLTITGADLLIPMFQNALLNNSNTHVTP